MLIAIFKTRDASWNTRVHAMWRVWYDEGGLSVGATPLILLSRARIEIPHQSMVVARQKTDADPYRHVNFAEMTLSVFLLVIFQLKLLSPSSFHMHGNLSSYEVCGT